MSYYNDRNDYLDGVGTQQLVTEIGAAFSERQLHNHYLKQIRALEEKLNAVSRQCDQSIAGWEEAAEQRDVWRKVARELATEQGLDKSMLKARVDRHRGL
ncbi:hypothetical protein PH214_16080 (plasmid) [Nitratidesulfovibrio vulgaris]|nr:hypothetical protein [Nitratidesulfovibrio vulgaris]WCB48161.1 hypothetical protein PH214_16080 [Nitratidesulfovibrio vulgaris]